MPNFNIIFAQSGARAPISDEEWAGGWATIVGGINGIPTAQQFNMFGYLMEQKSNMAKGIADNAWDASQDAITAAIQAQNAADTASDTADLAASQVAGAVAAAALAQQMANDVAGDVVDAQEKADDAYDYAAANYLLILAAQNLLSNHEGRISSLESAVFNNITGNPFTVLFDDLDGLTVTGVWNQTSQRIEC